MVTSQAHYMGFTRCCSHLHKIELFRIYSYGCSGKCLILIMLVTSIIIFANLLRHLKKFVGVLFAGKFANECIVEPFGRCLIHSELLDSLINSSTLGFGDSLLP